MGKSGGIGFCGLLTIVFVIFKLLGKLAWSWPLVFAPLWVPALIGLICGASVLALMVLAEIWKEFKRSNRE